VTNHFATALAAYTKDVNKIYDQISHSAFSVLNGTKVVAAWDILCFKT
jgi:hypothetical protein